MTKPMEKNEFVDKLCAGKLDRRAFNRVLASVGLATVAMPLVPQWARGALNQPMVFEWSGYELPEFHQGYIDKHGESPTFSFFGEEEEAMQKMRAGFQADISHPCTYSTRRWRDAGLLKPVDNSRLEHWGDVFASLKTLAGSVGPDGKNYFVPWDWGNSSVLYRTDLVDPEYIEEESWMILFDERYKGRLGIYDSVDGVMGVVGLVIGAENPFNMTDEELERATVMLRKQRELLRYYWTDQTSVQQALVSGELIASYAWNDAYVALKKEGIPVKYMKPKEGIYTWVCGFALISSGEADEDLVYDYLNAAMEPEVGAFLINEYGYGHSNVKAFGLVPEERLAELGVSDPVSHIEGSKYFEEIDPAVREKYITLFEEIKAGF